MEKPKECPKCQSADVKRILYGYMGPNFVPSEDEVLGGCVVSDELWYCGKCEHQWGPDGGY